MQEAVEYYLVDGKRIIGRLDKADESRPMAIKLSPPFVAIDFDEAGASAQAERIIKSYIKIFTVRGNHLVIRLPRGVLLPSSCVVVGKGEVRRIILDPLTNCRRAVVVSGGAERAVADRADFLCALSQLKEVSLVELDALISAAEEAPTAIMDFAAKFYAPGARHNVSLYLALAMKACGVDQAQAQSVIEAIARSFQDEELQDRLRVVSDVYERYSSRRVQYAGVDLIELVRKELCSSSQ